MGQRGFVLSDEIIHFCNKTLSYAKLLRGGHRQLRMLNWIMIICIIDQRLMLELINGFECHINDCVVKRKKLTGY